MNLLSFVPVVLIKPEELEQNKLCKLTETIPVESVWERLADLVFPAFFYPINVLVYRNAVLSLSSLIPHFSR